jgi:uncharacterized membrane protein HdeD (DUF308 family)
MPEKKPIWKYVKILGIVVLILGVALLAYSGYAMLSVPAGLQQRTFTMNATARAAFNATGRAGYPINQSRYAAMAATGAIGMRSDSLSNLLSGILLALLGALMYKYAQLKETIHAHTKK